VDTVLDKLATILEQRRSAAAGSSYVSSLYAAGRSHILEKIEEEAAELVTAGKDETDCQVIHETADLWFHTLVLLAERGLHPKDVLGELERRFGKSGLEEKAERGAGTA
jgi:phosphoribosyl-ATP pyrophosphohydrolase